MKKYSLSLISAVFAALFSTLCCLPAFVFIFFGINSSLLAFFTTFEYLRIPMAILSIGLFLLGIIQFKRNLFCICDKKSLIKTYAIFIIIFWILSLLLLYPEILPLFME
jgi:mercuric ion transport protein